MPKNYKNFLNLLLSPSQSPEKPKDQNKKLGLDLMAWNRTVAQFFIFIIMNQYIRNELNFIIV